MKAATLKIAFRKSGKVVVLHRNRVVCKCSDLRSAKLFIQGWREGEAERAAQNANPDFISGFVDAQTERKQSCNRKS